MMKSYRYDTALGENVAFLALAPKRNAARPHPWIRMSEKVDSRAMREVNRSIVLDMIRQTGTISRTDLARRSALTKPTVGAIVDGLLSSGVIHEVGLGKALRGGGRPARLLALNGESAAYAALSFEATEVRAAISDATGEVRSLLDAPLAPGDPRDAVRMGLDLVERALERAGFPQSKLNGVGVVIAGVVDADTGMCVEAPHLGWSEFDLVSALDPIGAVPVVVSSSCNASALAEGRVGVAQGCQSFVWLEIGRGISAGIVIHGQVFHGRGGFSGDIGRCRVALHGPSLDDVASERALERAYGEARGDALEGRAGVPASAVIDAALAGESAARAALDQVAEQLCLALSHVFGLLSPEMIVLGGQLARADRLLVQSIEAAAGRHALRSTLGEIRVSHLDGDVALRGALLSAMERSVPSFRLVSTNVVATES